MSEEGAAIASRILKRLETMTTPMRDAKRLSLCYYSYTKPQIPTSIIPRSLTTKLPNSSQLKHATNNSSMNRLH